MRSVQHSIPKAIGINIHHSTLVIAIWQITFCFLLLTSCQSIAQKNKPYHEDLSRLRPKAELKEETKNQDTLRGKNQTYVVPTKTVNAIVDAVLDSIDRLNVTRKFIDGYTIQIYSGQKREEAMNVKKKMQEQVSQLNANLQYLQPKFRVTVGKYFTRLEAQPDLLTLKRKFSTATLVPEKILIK